MKLVNFEKGGTYLFDQQNLASAHAECEANTEAAFTKGFDHPIFRDNQARYPNCYLP